MMHFMASLSLGIAAIALTGCSRESVGERLARECGQVVDS
jgi:hypothetical protein